MGRITFPFTLVMASLWAATAPAADAPPAVFEDFGFTVTDARVVDELQGAMGNTLTATEGNQLVIVAVSGEAAGAVDLELDPGKFSARYAISGETQSNAAKAVSPGNVWLFGENMGYVMTANIEQAGPYKFEVAVAVPEDVTEFDIYHLETSLGKAVLNP